MAEFIYNNKSSKQFGLRIKNDIVIKSPKVDVSFEEIPGRDGDVVVSNERLSGFDFTFPCSVTKHAEKHSSLFKTKDDINAWLYQNIGFNDLYFSGDPIHVYKAMYTGGDDLERVTSWFGNINITFRVHPWKYLIAGLEEIDDPSIIYNPTEYDALPILKITGDGSVDISFTNGSDTQVVELINLNPLEEITIDCDTEEVYSGSDNRSYRMVFNPFPKLRKGGTTITVTGTYSSFKIIPRWRAHA